ncbi:MAG: hypothetical protein KAR19_12655 [Bacteroidales bacterium]|nr:hypothetical protein [Bacteroidales bacterium]
MYALTFKRSRSKHILKELNHVVSMGESWDATTEKLMITEKALSVCRWTVEKLQKKISVLRQEIIVIIPEWREWKKNRQYQI